MKNFVRTLVFITILLVASPAYSQPREQPPFSDDPARTQEQQRSREDFARTQAKHIAVDLNFDGPTTELFVDAYCKYQQELWALGPRIKQPAAGATDQESEDAMKARFDRGHKILELREKYYEIYSTFLTQEQIQRVYEVEKKMMTKMRPSHPRKGEKPRPRR